MYRRVKAGYGFFKRNVRANIYDLATLYDIFSIAGDCELKRAVRLYLAEKRRKAEEMLLLRVVLFADAETVVKEVKRWLRMS
ncbi:MAG: hypothetical protein QW196_05400 [Sulfolobales archaeon]